MRVHNPDQASTGPWFNMDSSRIKQARYDRGQRQIQVIFHNHGRDTPYTYDGVEPQVFQRLLRSASPGKFVDRVLNGYPHFPGGFSYADSEEE